MFAKIAFFLQILYKFTIFVQLKRSMEYKILNSINSPDDLKQLSISELNDYSEELRHYIIDECAVNPGHLASGLGVIELTIALHYVYNTPNDKLIWDVGHQTYPHKIITGRREEFKNKRRKGGISGFPRICESEYDAFGGGHSSVSISAAFGMAKVAELQGEDRRIVAIIGDGSMTGGLAFEGLNNAGASPSSDILVILNDNDMAIDNATGALNNYLLRIATSSKYNRFKQWLWRGLSHTPTILHLCQRFGSTVKQGLLHNSNFFESLNFRYFGPVDGHNINGLVRTLKALRDISGPKILHIRTVKGKGYSHAESNNLAWHAPGLFDPKTGVRYPSSKRERFQDVFGQTLVDLAELDDRIVGITPAMLSGSSMNIMKEKMPHRCFDVGIAEGHAVTFSAGIAASGMIPFCNIYSSFMQRAYDNVIHDVAIQKLPVIFCLDRGGLVGEDGATHHGAYDLAYLSAVPELVVSAPRNEIELRNMMYTALKAGRPFSIRYPRGGGEGTIWKGQPFQEIPIGKGEKLCDGDNIAIITVGTTAHLATQAISQLSEDKINVAHYDMRFAKPLDEEMLREIGAKYKYVLTVEDGALRGGVGEAISAFYAQNGYCLTIKSLGIPDQFIEHGTPSELYAECGFDSKSIASIIHKWH